jgi:hypothetical protein
MKGQRCARGGVAFGWEKLGSVLIIISSLLRFLFYFSNLREKTTKTSLESGKKKTRGGERYYVL